MVGYFPRQSIAWKIEEPAAFRALTLSVVESGLLAGVLYAIALAFTPAGRLLLVPILEALWYLGLFGAAAAHLANYPLRHWIWRAPAFAILAAVGTMATSAALIALHRERLGSARATWHDWPSIALRVLGHDLISICLFALVLAGVVQIVRSALLRHEHRA